MTIAVEVSNLRKIFGKGESTVEAVKGIDLKIKKGELFGFLGPNGAGKTTSLKMMVGLLRPTEGEVSIMGKDPKTQLKEIKQAIGIVPQDVSIYEALTVEENLWFMAKAYHVPKKTAKERIDGLIEQIGLQGKRKAIARTLSGGQKRRLNLIMGLIHDPEIILMDEPTPGLDPQSRVAVWEFISNLTRRDNKTVILTTHFMEEADRLADNVAIIDNGEILVVQSPDKLKGSIGEGDLVEIAIAKKDLLENVKKALGEFKGVQEVKIIEDELLIRCLDVIPKMAAILNIIEEYSEVIDLRIRNTTLEDVFIHLTGRSLRD